MVYDAFFWASGFVWLPSLGCSGFVAVVCRVQGFLVSGLVLQGRRAASLGFRAVGLLLNLVAEWIHFTLFGIILPTVKLNVYTFWGL